MRVHINSEGEKITIEDRFMYGHTPVKVLVIHDDPPPNGSCTSAPTLLDKSTRAWLRSCLDELDEDNV